MKRKLIAKPGRGIVASRVIASTETFNSQVEQLFYDTITQYDEYRDDPVTIAEIIIEHIEMLSEDEDYGSALSPLPRDYRTRIHNYVRSMM